MGSGDSAFITFVVMLIIGMLIFCNVNMHVPYSDIQNAVKLCQADKGLDIIEEDHTGEVEVDCANGAQYDYNSSKEAAEAAAKP